jgi:hypothetical protein
VLPDLSTFSSGVLVGALSVAAIVLVQGAGVAESAPNPDGSRARTGQDIMAQGAANVAAGAFGGQPVGGSVGQTAMNVSVGARSRWGAIWSGIWMLLILVALSGVVGLVAKPTLAAVLIYAAVGSFRPREVMSLLRAGRTAQIALVATLARATGVVLTLLPPAVGRAMDHATEGRPSGPVMRTRRGTRMDRHAATRRLHPRRPGRCPVATNAPHMLRHTFITTMLNPGVDLRDVQIAARHADPRTTMRHDRAHKSLDRHRNYILAASWPPAPNATPPARPHHATVPMSGRPEGLRMSVAA